MVVDGYTQTYDSGEISEVTIDTIVGIGASIFSFVSLVALVILFVWLRRQFR